jgi:hypothetical protein
MSVQQLNEESERPAVILGSGFSRSIAEAMPTMPELGTAVLEELGLDADVLAPFGGNLEQWMSFLSIDQPWLTTAENYDNRGRFARVSEAVYTCIVRAETEVVQQPIPIWLQRLAWTWCDQRARVFSFNYDTLVERAASGVNRLGSLADLYVAALTNRQAPGDGGAMFGPGPARGPLLSLYKLHGSTSWAFGGLDGPSNDRITLWNSALRWGITQTNEEENDSPRYVSIYDDLVPLIVPPTLTKGPFFANLALRAQWRRAAQALRSANTLTILGYSFPAADLVAQQWVSTSFSGSRMDVVDKEAERPALIRANVANAPEGEDITGDCAIERYVDRECGDHVAWSIRTETEGTRVSLEVNGVDLLEGMDPANSRWGTTDYSDAQKWVHATVEAAGGRNDVDFAQGALDGSSESRHVVLAAGRHLTL